MKTPAHKHPSEMPDDVLTSLGFVKAPSPYGGDYWTHPKRAGHFYYHILTADATAEALIEVGHEEFRKRVNALDMSED